MSCFIFLVPPNPVKARVADKLNATTVGLSTSTLSFCFKSQFNLFRKSPSALWGFERMILLPNKETELLTVYSRCCFVKPGSHLRTVQGQRKLGKLLPLATRGILV